MTRLLATLVALLVLTLPAQAADLSVFTAASLTEVCGALANSFHKLHPDVRVHVTTAASGTLLRRMQGGARPDVFISADAATMDQAVASGRVDPVTRMIVAGNTLVMAVPAGNPARVANLDSLPQGGVRRVGVGNPETVPAGRYAKRALSQNALWFALAAKLVYYPSVRHVLTALTKRKIDAGFIYRTDAVLAGKSVEIVATFPLNPPVVYVAAQCAATPHKTQADLFLVYLLSPAAKATFSRFGFSTP